jgi:N-acetylmuramoyl-L-alanine amidase
MIINRKICQQGLHNNPNRPLKAINYITIHCTGNYDSTATAKNHANYLYSGSVDREVSWHYTVDKSEIWQSFEDTSECWHAGDGGNGDGNYSSIGIEICVNDRAGFRQACLNAAWLTATLLQKHSLTIDKVVQHAHWMNKDCPHELRSGCWGVTWDDFISMVKQALEPSAPIPAPSTGFSIGDRVILNGTVYSDSYGGGKGHTFQNKTCTVTRIVDFKRACPYLLDNGLGWVTKCSIRKV